MVIGKDHHHHATWLFVPSARCGTQTGLRAGAHTILDSSCTKLDAGLMDIYSGCAYACRHHCKGLAQRQGPAKQDRGHPRISRAAA